MKKHIRILLIIIICLAVSGVCLGYFLGQKIVTVNEDSYSGDTLIAAKGTVRREIFESLKSECGWLDGDYELIDYRLESFRWEKDKYGGWESYASARGICDDTPQKQRRLVLVGEDSYSGDTRAQAEAKVREEITDSLKSECGWLDDDYELADYNFQFFECEKDKYGGWECYADAVGFCRKEK
jgi:hypothetical protein